MGVSCNGAPLLYVGYDMNIFATSECPRQSALWLDDVRKNKMIVESAQLLSAGMNVLAPFHKFEVYKTTHVNHPCAVWARDSRNNFKWLLDHLNALLEQWGNHKTGGLVPAFTAFYNKGRFGREDQTPFVNCTASFKHWPNTLAAYRAQMVEKWDTDTIPLSWAKGEKPPWYKG